MLFEDIKADFMKAMKARDDEKKDVLGVIKSEIEYEAKRKKQDLSDKTVIEVLSRLIKNCRQAHEVYLEKQKNELAQKELNEIKIIEKYLPDQLSLSELKKVIQNKINEIGASGPKDMGRLMSVVMKDVKGKTDGKTVSSLVRDILTG